MEIGDRRFKDADADATENVPPRPDSWNFLMRDSHALIASKMNLQSFLCETLNAQSGLQVRRLGEDTLARTSSSADRRWRRVLAALGNPPNLAWSGDAYQVAQILTFDPGNRSSITACVAAARENARQVREEISSEQWQRLNHLFHQVTRHKPNETDDVLPSDFLLAVIEGVHLIQGVTDSTMSHGEGWHFIQVGRYMERACATVTLLGLYHREFWGHPDQTPEASEYLEWIDRVSPASRAALLLHYEQHLSLEETAAILDVPVGTVKSRLSYGLASIRNQLKENYKR